MTRKSCSVEMRNAILRNHLKTDSLRDGIPENFDNVNAEFIVNNRTDALKTDINLFFYDNKFSNCPLSFVDVSYRL